MLATTAPPTTSARMSLPPASLMYSCTRMFMLAALKASMIDLAEAAVSARITPHALRALQQLDDAGRAADLLDHVLGAARTVREGRHRQADALARQQLQRAQLVARAADGHALVQRKHALHLELAQHGQAVVRDRGADARDDGIVVRQHAPAVPQRRLARRDVHVHVQRVDHVDLVAARPRRLDDAPMRIEARIAREHDELHAARTSAAASPPRTDRVAMALADDLRPAL